VPVIAGAGGQVFVTSSNGILYELDEATGATISSFQFCTEIECTVQPLVLAGNHLALSTYNSVIVF